MTGAHLERPKMGFPRDSKSARELGRAYIIISIWPKYRIFLWVRSFLSSSSESVSEIRKGDLMTKTNYIDQNRSNRSTIYVRPYPSLSWLSGSVFTKSSGLKRARQRCHVVAGGRRHGDANAGPPLEELPSETTRARVLGLGLNFFEFEFRVRVRDMQGGVWWQKQTILIKIGQFGRRCICRPFVQTFANPFSIPLTSGSVFTKLTEQAGPSKWSIFPYGSITNSALGSSALDDAPQLLLLAKIQYKAAHWLSHWPPN